MDTDHCFKDFKTWRRPTPLAQGCGVVWDNDLIETTIKVSWEQLVIHATRPWEPEAIVKVLVKEQGDLYVFGKKDDGSFVIGHRPRESKPVDLGVLTAQDADMADVYINARRSYVNSSPLKKRVIYVGFCYAFGWEMADILSHESVHVDNGVAEL